mmetsp:Transcript_54916/g.120402  ORF Transcript_54916/g.120402 Transcript_54916/m.120402 type:complete len:117 (+) Transcript_54916:507-857(+)
MVLFVLGRVVCGPAQLLQAVCHPSEIDLTAASLLLVIRGGVTAECAGFRGAMRTLQCLSGGRLLESRLICLLCHVQLGRGTLGPLSAIRSAAQLDAAALSAGGWEPWPAKFWHKVR